MDADGAPLEPLGCKEHVATFPAHRIVVRVCGGDPDNMDACLKSLFSALAQAPALQVVKSAFGAAQRRGDPYQQVVELTAIREDSGYLRPPGSGNRTLLEVRHPVGFVRVPEMQGRLVSETITGMVSLA